MEFIYHRKNRRKYSLKSHIVLVTKYRRKLLDASLSQTLKAIAQKIAEENNFSIITIFDKRNLSISKRTTNAQLVIELGFCILFGNDHLLIVISRGEVWAK